LNALLVELPTVDEKLIKTRLAVPFTKGFCLFAEFAAFTILVYTVENSHHSR